MNKKSLAGLVVLNAALVLVLGVLCLTPRPVQAQIGGGGGDYTMIAGATPGQETRTVYIIEIDTGRMVAVRYDVSRKGIQILAARNIADDVKDEK